MKKGLSFELIGEKGNNRPSSNMRGIKEGDVVILKEEETVRCLWKLARIIETIKG